MLSYTRDVVTGKISRRVIKNEANTLHCSTGGGGNTDQYVITFSMDQLDNIAIRKLTPRECYRLMGVPDNKIDILLSCGLAKGAHYKLAGNSIVVNVMADIFRKMWIEKSPEVGQQLQIF